MPDTEQAPRPARRPDHQKEQLPIFSVWQALTGMGGGPIIEPMTNRTNTKPSTLTRLSKEIVALAYRGCEDILCGDENAISDAVEKLIEGRRAGLSISSGDITMAAAYAAAHDGDGFCEHFESIAQRLGDDLDLYDC